MRIRKVRVCAAGDAARRRGMAALQVAVSWSALPYVPCRGGRQVPLDNLWISVGAAGDCAGLAAQVQIDVVEGVLGPGADQWVAALAVQGGPDGPGVELAVDAGQVTKAGRRYRRK